MDFLHAPLNWNTISAFARIMVVILSAPGLLWGGYRFIRSKQLKRLRNDLKSQTHVSDAASTNVLTETASRLRTRQYMLWRIIGSLYVAILGPSIAGVASLYVYDKYFKVVSVGDALWTNKRQADTDLYDAKSFKQWIDAQLGQSAPNKLSIPSIDPCEAARDHWRASESIGTISAFSDHLNRFPTCQFAELARVRITQIQDQTQKTFGVDNAAAEIGRGIDVVSKFIKQLLASHDQDLIQDFYRGRDFNPVWIFDGKPNDRARKVILFLENVDADGLDPADYPLPHFSESEDPKSLARDELTLTNSVLAFVRHAQVGRVHWSRMGPAVFYDGKPSSPADILTKLNGADDVAAVLQSYEPENPAYQSLKTALAEIRAGRNEAFKAGAVIPDGPVLKLGMQDDRVPQLRTRLGVSGENGLTYDRALVEAVKKFQRRYELGSSGLLTSATVKALNAGQPEHAAETVIANMERWRWLPHDLGAAFVLVNLPDFTLKVIRAGGQIWATRITIGKPARPTPIMSAQMTGVTVNPTWEAPSSIVRDEYLPALRQDPTVLERMGMIVSRYRDGTIHVTQPPGDRTVLGRFRFNFTNRFAVDQHDTPDKYLFAYDRRAFDRCDMQVQDPAKYAEVLLSIARPGDAYTSDRMRRMFADSAVDIRFPAPIPIHVTYQTAFVDENGKLQFREDIYGMDSRLWTALKSRPPIIDSPVTQPQVKEGDDCASLYGSNDEISGFFEHGNKPPFSFGSQPLIAPGDQGFFSRLFDGSSNVTNSR